MRKLDVRVCAMRAGKSLSVSSADIRRLKAVVQDRQRAAEARLAG